MKTLINRFAFTLFLMVGLQFAALAQVTPSTSGVNLFCESGATLTLDDPAGAYTYTVLYNTTDVFAGSTAVNLTGNTITGTDLKTGYYYVMTTSTVAGSCISAPKTVPVYILPTLTVSIDGADYCEENQASATITANVTGQPTSEFGANYGLAYQWYKDVAGTPTAISGATSDTYSPPMTNPGDSETYQLKVGYLVNTTDKYCPAVSSNKTITVTAKPTAPVINVSGNADSVTF